MWIISIGRFYNSLFNNVGTLISRQERFLLHKNRFFCQLIVEESWEDEVRIPTTHFFTVLIFFFSTIQQFLLVQQLFK